MSAILSTNDLNDFISPGVACVKPVENLPKRTATSPYEVVKEGQIPEENTATQISLTDCLACSGCVTSAEAVLISLQSHNEVLTMLECSSPDTIFVASISPQVRASLATTYAIPEQEAGYLIEQLLCGPKGLKRAERPAFTWAFATDVFRDIGLVMGSDECLDSVMKPAPTSISTSKQPVLSSACPGWICYAEKTHPHIIPHLSSLKSPQAIAGTMIKSTLSRSLSISPSKIYHLAVMPCFDKKLEASREELTDFVWRQNEDLIPPTRDVDCVITTREILMLAENSSIRLLDLPRIPAEQPRFPSDFVHHLCLEPSNPSHLDHTYRSKSCKRPHRESGTSGGYLHHILQAKVAQNPGSSIKTMRGRNADIVEYQVIDTDSSILLKCARYYGFRNIQNLVRKLKPARASRLPGAAKNRRLVVGGASTRAAPSDMSDYAFIEVMACPGGCSNGGGQIKVDDLPQNSPSYHLDITGRATQKEWLDRVDEAYFSASSMDEPLQKGLANRPTSLPGELINGISHASIHSLLQVWSESTEIPIEKLIMTTYRALKTEDGKRGQGEDINMAEAAAKVANVW